MDRVHFSVFFFDEVDAKDDGENNECNVTRSEVWIACTRAIAE